MPKIIGLTGGIGSGKTTLANYIQSLEIPVYISDKEARILTQTPEILDKIKNTFGENIFENQKLNTSKLAKLVFSDKEKLSKLNSIIHPEVEKHFESWKSKQNSTFVVYETAILFESGKYRDCYKIINVVSPLETRIERVIMRDKITKEQVLERIDNQWTDKERTLLSDFVIDNTIIEEAKKQVFLIIEAIRADISVKPV